MPGGMSRAHANPKPSNCHKRYIKPRNHTHKNTDMYIIYVYVYMYTCIYTCIHVYIHVRRYPTSNKINSDNVWYYAPISNAGDSLGASACAIFDIYKQAASGVITVTGASGGAGVHVKSNEVPLSSLNVIIWDAFAAWNRFSEHKQWDPCRLVLKRTAVPKTTCDHCVRAGTCQRSCGPGAKQSCIPAKLRQNFTIH